MYFVQLSLPPNTTLSAPSATTLTIAPGVVRLVRIVHPTGCVDLVGVWVEYRAARLWPQNDGGYFLGNGSVLEFNPGSLLVEPPFELTLKGYNLDDTYTHKPTIAIEVEATGSAAERERGLFGFVLRQLGIGAIE